MSVDPCWVVEWSSAVLGGMYTVLAAYEKRLGWLFAIISSILFVAYYHHRGYPGQAVLNAYYVLMGAYGWFSWGRDEAAIPITRASIRFHVLAMCFGLLAALGLGKLLAHFAWSESPLMDGWVAVFSVLATWMMARKYLENWIYWCIVDGVAITMYLRAEPPMHAYALLFAAYVALSVVGWWRWSRALQAQR